MNLALRTLILVGAAAFVAGCGSKAAKPPVKPTPTTASTTSSNTIGSGKVTFGTGLAGTSVTHAATNFQSPPKLAWVAQFSKQPSQRVILTLTFVRGSGPHPKVVWTQKVRVATKSASLSLTKAQLHAHGVTKLGSYQVQYSSQGQPLATGTFTIVGKGGGGGGGY